MQSPKMCINKQQQKTQANFLFLLCFQFSFSRRAGVLSDDVSVNIPSRCQLKFKDFLFTVFTYRFLSGEVELENLPLKKDALSHFGLPIRAYSGSIGKIKLQVPVRQFRSAPWCINIEKVYIICGPVNLEEVRM